MVEEKVKKSYKGSFVWQEGHLHVTVGSTKTVFSIVQQGDEVTEIIDVESKKVYRKHTRRNDWN